MADEPTVGPFALHPSLVPLLADVDSVKPHPKNARRGDVAAIAESMRVNGVYRPVIAQRKTGYILAGNHTWAAMRQAGCAQVPVVLVDVDTATARRILLADNRIAELGTWDAEALAELVENVASDGGLSGTGYDPGDVDALLRGLRGEGDVATPLAEQWGVSPFSVIDTRGGQWQAQREAWADASDPDDALLLSLLLRWYLPVAGGVVRLCSAPKVAHEVLEQTSNAREAEPNEVQDLVIGWGPVPPGPVSARFVLWLTDDLTRTVRDLEKKGLGYYVEAVVARERDTETFDAVHALPRAHTYLVGMVAGGDWRTAMKGLAS